MACSTSRRRMLLAVSAVAALTLGLSPVAAASAGGPTVRVFPANSSPYGQSYSEWSARWWQWAWSVPAAVNPLLDETGANCGQGDQGKVFFLAGVINVSGSATRDCDVPDGKALLFPIINAEFDNQVCVEPDSDYTVKELRQQVTALIDTATALKATVDGANVDVTGFRFASPKFNITLPADNLAEALGCTEGPGTYGPAVGDGYYLMLKPLAPGPHTVTFSGSLPDFNFTLSIVYHLDVG